MLIRKALSFPFIMKRNLRSQMSKIIQINNKPGTSGTGYFNTNNINLSSRPIYMYSKQKIMQQFQTLNRELDVKYNRVSAQQGKKNQYQQKQETIIKDFLQLTQESFNENLQSQLDQKYLIDPQILLMIVSGLEDSNLIKSNLPKLYPFISTLKPSEILLLFELILAHKPSSIPPLSTVTPRPLQNIESLLLILSQVYKKDQRLIQWIKEVPLYKGENITMVAAGFFSIMQRIDQHLKFKNQKLIQRSIDRIINLVMDEDQQTKISTAILALQSPQTSHFAEQLLIQVQSFDYSEIDPLKTQLFFIYLQKHLYANYSEVRKQAKNKTKYKILQQSPQGQLTQKTQEQYILSPQIKDLQYNKISQIQKFKFLDSICKKTIEQIIDLNWKETLKLNLLLQYWNILETFEKAYPWNSFQSKLVAFTCEKEIIQKFTDLTVDEILSILQTMEKLKINKSHLLMKCLALLSQKLDILESHHFIKLSKVCVTFVRQCEDFLIAVRKQIESRKFIFDHEQIQELNSIFKRVLVLFPRPIVK